MLDKGYRKMSLFLATNKDGVSRLFESKSVRIDLLGVWCRLYGEQKVFSKEEFPGVTPPNWEDEPVEVVFTITTNDKRRQRAQESVHRDGQIVV